MFKKHGTLAVQKREPRTMDSYWLQGDSALRLCHRSLPSQSANLWGGGPRPSLCRQPRWKAVPAVDQKMYRISTHPGCRKFLRGLHIVSSVTTGVRHGLPHAPLHLTSTAINPLFSLQPQVAARTAFKAKPPTQDALSQSVIHVFLRPGHTLCIDIS